MIGSFCFFLLFPTSIYDDEGEEKKEKEKERGCFFYFLVRRTGARARLLAYILSGVAKCETHTHIE